MKVKVSSAGCGTMRRLGGAAVSGGRRTRRHDQEHICWDPKDGELCLSRVKPGETLVEARSDTDVQIVRLTWV
jgi:hypothetical protein